MRLPWRIPGGQQVQRSVHRIGGSEGGPVIVRSDGAMQSENFVTGVSGWRFDAQGNLEANDGTFRGTLTTGGPGPHVDIGGSNNAYIDLFSGDGDEVAPGYINVGVDSTGPSDFGYINMVAPRFSAGGGRTYIDLRHFDDGTRTIDLFADTEVGIYSNSIILGGSTRFHDGTLADPAISFGSDPNTGIYRWGVGSWSLTTNGADAIDIAPGYLAMKLPTYLDDVAIFQANAFFNSAAYCSVDPVEVLMPYVAGWGDYGTGYLPPKVRKDFNGFARLEGLVLKLTSTAPPGTQIAALPVGMFPAGIAIFNVLTSVGVQRVDINTAGTVTYQGPATLPIGGWISFDGHEFYAGW